MHEVSKANDAISSIPTTIDEFAQALALLRQTQSKMNGLDDRYMFFKLLYGLTDKYKIKVTMTANGVLVVLDVRCNKKQKRHRVWPS